jgi:hypothetical protein
MVVFALPFAVLGLLVALVLAVLWALRPAPADDELVAWAAQRDDPAPARILAVRTGNDGEGCALEVTLQSVSTGPPDEHPGLGGPVAGAEVVVEVRHNSLLIGEDAAASDDRGQVRFDDLPCGATTVRAEAPGMVAAYTELPLSPEAGLVRIDLLMQGGMVLQGRVTGPEGEAVADARISAWPAADTTDADGRYTLTVSPQERVWVRAEAFGYVSSREEARVEEPAPGITVDLDLELEAARHVRVYCAGMPEDDCGDVFLSCTEPFVPFGNSCRQWDALEAMVCHCPDGDAAVRGGGRSVLIGPDEDEAWLDFRNTGSLVGGVRFEGEPAPGCDVAVIRIPTGLEDVPRGGFAARRTKTDLEGRYELLGLVEGDWQVEVHCFDPATGEPLERSTTPLAVKPRRETDAGELELLGGGSIEGLLVDGLTGEPISHHPVMGLREAAGAQRRSPALADTDSQGRFQMGGLPPGQWTLAHPLSPHQSTTVQVEDGVITDGVVIETSEATALVENGFTVAAEGEEIVVSGVDEGGPAWDAGLLEGDVVEGVLIAGFDVGSMLGELEPDLTRLVLGQWDGPGVTLVVDREGERVEVPLEW